MAMLPRLAVRTFAQVSPFQLIAAQDVITRYGDHQRRVRDMKGGAAADGMFRIGQLAHLFVERLETGVPIREIQVIGHSDRVWVGGKPHTADEQKVSEERAQDVLRELMAAILRDPAGRFTPLQLQEAIRNGQLRIVVIALGARQPLRLNPAGATPENRRVEVKLLTKQSTPI